MISLESDSEILPLEMKRIEKKKISFNILQLILQIEIGIDVCFNNNLK